MITAPSPRHTRDLDQLFLRLKHNHDPEVRDELVRRFQPLARTIARRYVSPREPFEDLVQVANLGLLKAVKRFDPIRGTTFRAFAVPTILGELKRYFRDRGWAVYVTRGAQDLALKVEHAQLERRGSRVPSLTALAEYLELGIEEVAEGLVLRFAREMTQAQIGERVGVSQMQVSRILRRTLGHLHDLSAEADTEL